MDLCVEEEFCTFLGPAENFTLKSAYKKTFLLWSTSSTESMTFCYTWSQGTRTLQANFGSKFHALISSNFPQCWKYQY